jgi:hypothetical protein
MKLKESEDLCRMTQGWVVKTLQPTSTNIVVWRLVSLIWLSLNSSEFHILLHALAV